MAANSSSACLQHRPLPAAGRRARQDPAWAQDDRPVIQDYCPFPESIEWQLGQGYLRERGSKAFLHDTAPVPYVVNNDGTLSQSAAELLFASLAEAERRGGLEEQLFVLELGVGVGLFARLFLDAFRALCQQHGKNYYHRLCYVAGDYADRMLLDTCRHGVFANHPGRYVLRGVDALQPETLRESFGQGNDAPGPFRAVFLNYLLDCLPATVLRRSEAEVQQLCVRTRLARGVPPGEHAGLDGDDLLRKFRSADPEERRVALDAFHLFVSEYDYRPVDLATIRHGDFALRFARAAGSGQVLHSYGAIQSLDKLLGLLHEQGFILINDYGQTQVSEEDAFEHQRFSGSTFVGVNFSLLRAFFGESGTYRWVEPAEEEASIHSRLLGHRPLARTIDRFHQLFGKAAYQATHEPANVARALARAGRTEAALAAYRRALERQPLGWLLMSEVARFLTFALDSPPAGVALAREALALNPNSSAELWNTLGDALFALGRFPASRHAFTRALEINPRDVRAHYNLAFVHLQKKDYPEALRAIAQGLALDAAGEFREGLLQKQQEVLGHLANRHRREVQLMANRTSCYHLPPQNGHGTGRGQGAAGSPLLGKNLAPRGTSP
jgi:tetratricopeptide (TPR) repeat protein